MKICIVVFCHTRFLTLLFATTWGPLIKMSSWSRSQTDDSGESNKNTIGTATVTVPDSDSSSNCA